MPKRSPTGSAMMSRIRITELLHEVARETGFMTAFTNMRTGENCPNESALLATILADATNLGLSRMAAASQGVTCDQLVWTQDAYVREEPWFWQEKSASDLQPGARRRACSA
ncbi:Tn3 family transposase [Mesorhizobium sp. M0701]|uniref:Tn3 family transposase n=1 Tax=unclassified Mesorhizobium TaxID=325217 RepID=UPI0033388DFA